MVIHKGTEISSSTSPADLLSYVTLISSSITVGGLIAMVDNLPRNDNSKKIGSLMCGSSMNVRRVINELRLKSDVSLSDEWLVNTEINFSAFAMGGHTIFMLPDESFTAAGLVAKEQYKRCIGGVDNISMFSESTVMEGKEERAKILLKWASHFRRMNVAKYQNSLSRVFPHIVKDRSWFFTRWFGSMTGFIGRFISGIFRIIYWIFSFIWSIVKYLLLALVIFYCLQVITKAVFPTTASAVINGLSTNVSAVERETFVGSLNLAAKDVIPTGMGIGMFLWGGIEEAGSYLWSGGSTAVFSVKDFYLFSTKAYRTGGKSATAWWVNYDGQAYALERFGAFTAEVMRAVSAISSVALNKPVKFETSVISMESMKILKSAMLGDMGSFGFGKEAAPDEAKEAVPEKEAKKTGTGSEKRKEAPKKSPAKTPDNTEFRN